MRIYQPGVMTFVIVLAGVSPARAADRSTRCVATAGLAKHVAATSTEGIERTGSYDVTLTASAGIVEMRVEPKHPVEAGEATKVAAPIERVLLRSPYKSEATALPARSAAAGTDLVATFELDAVRKLPSGDVNAVVITADGERSCRIKNGDRRKLTAPR